MGFIDASLAEAPARRTPRVSEVLRRLADEAKGETVTIAEIVAGFGERAFGFMLIVFSLPNCIPAPPGMNSIFGIPMLLFAVQMAMGRREPWLPKKIREKAIRTKDLRRIVDVAEPKIRKVENLCRPRQTWMFSNFGDRMIGFFATACAISVIIPLPGTNLVPAVATVLTSLAVMEEDGVVLTIAGVFGLVGLAYTVFIVGALVGVARAGAAALFGF
jgi:hypothetical protein